MIGDGIQCIEKLLYRESERLNLILHQDAMITYCIRVQSKLCSRVKCNGSRQREDNFSHNLQRSVADQG